PQVFLFDEPLSNLDAKLRVQMRTEIKELHQRLKTTSVYVTHDQAEAMGLGDRIAVLDAGTVRQLGPPTEVYDDPADTFVATFIGSPPMNLVPRDGVLVGFRPEHLLPAGHVAGHVSGERITVPFEVERIEYLSGDRHVYGSVTRLGEQTRVVARLPATMATSLTAGDTHEFAVATERLRFFDAASGLRTDPVPVGS
ncbi:MAG: ABC transporter ATP-binding protein, partial [Pseudonocardiaceae bacterium]